MCGIAMAAFSRPIQIICFLCFIARIRMYLLRMLWLKAKAKLTKRKICGVQVCVPILFLLYYLFS